MDAAQVHISWNNSENKIKARPDSAWGILAHRFLLDSACSSHGPKSTFSCTRTPPLWVSPCEPHHQTPDRNKSRWHCVYNQETNKTTPYICPDNVKHKILWRTWSLILCLMMSSSCSVVSSVITGAKKKTKIKCYCLFWNRKQKDILAILMVTFIKQHKCNIGVTHPSWMSGQTPHLPPACCSLDEPAPSPLQTAARASLQELLSLAHRSSLTSAN